MDCPSCQQELDSIDLPCPWCGHLPTGGASQATAPVPVVPAAAVAPVAPVVPLAPPASPWADPHAAWHSVSPATRAEAAAEPAPDPDVSPETEPTIAEPNPFAAEPTLDFGSPQQYLAAAGSQPAVLHWGEHVPTVPQAPAWSTPVAPGQPAPVWGSPLAAGQQAPAWGVPVSPQPPRKRRLALPILVLTFAVLIAGGGIATAGYFLGWFGGGTHPADVMPATTAVYVQLDLNPSLAQKAQAWEFLRDLPEVKKAVASRQPDPKRMIWDLLSQELGTIGEANYDTDVKPWLGDRVGYGMVPNGDKTSWVAAIQLTDETAGATQLRKLIRDNDGTFEVTIRSGYALVTPTADTSFVLGELTKGTLARNNDHFSADMGTLGDTGIMAAWVDAGAQKLTSGTSGSMKARAAYALRFAPDTLTLDGRLFAMNTGGAAAGAGELGNLPATTQAAVSISGGAASLKLLWPSFGAEASSWLKQYGLEEADVEALLGRSFSLSMPTSSAAEMFSPDRAVGLRVVSDDVTRAQHALTTLSASAPNGIRMKVDGDVLTAATTATYLAELTGNTSKLSGSGDFTKAVPDHARATAAFYLNLAPLVATAEGSNAGEYSDFVKAMRAAGGEYVDEGSGNGSWSVRIVRS